MRSFIRPLAFFCAALSLCVATASAQTDPSRSVPATITGRVTDGEKGIAGVAVSLLSADPSTRFRTIARAKTDGEGRYRLWNVPPGRYQIRPFAPVYVVQGAGEWPPGKPLMLAAGEEVSDIDFRIERGGVVTGRVTDADGNPLVGEMVSVAPVDDKGVQRRGFTDPRDFSTDDRGIYRLYGLQPGRYRFSVGQSEERGAISYGRRKLYRRTFYPDATEEAGARIVEVTAGGEATDIDITVGRALKTFRASGRFVSAETGEAVPNVSFSYGTLDPRGRRIERSLNGPPTNARGEFLTEGLTPGRYAVFTSSQENVEWYSEAAPFEVTDADVKGIVVKLRRGSSARGVVTIEGVSDRATAARLMGSVRLYGFVEARSEIMVQSGVRPVAVGADGSFRFTGLRPGKLRINAGGEMKGLTVSRVELSGASASGGIDIVEGAQVAGVRVVLAYGSGVVRGQLSFTNGTLPAGARVFAHARRVGAGNEERGGRSAEVDARGRFVIEGLAPGEYEIRAQVYSNAGVYQSDAQHASLAENGDMNVALTLDLSAPRNRGGRP
ncbi:MAG: carboxypeptidase regulatory-like domain-containing protein [Rubrivivax sp.]|nr:carboxypeptidase regulatory-like domain-containing protein [Pyrinomonadaceae bacterium]